MEFVVFQFWILVLVITVAYAFFKRDAKFLLISGLLFIGFGWTLTFQGVNIINGIDADGAYTFNTILPANDTLFLIFAIGTLPAGVALALFSLTIMVSEAVDRVKVKVKQ